MKIGGGINHRFGLFDMIMIKDNHIDFSGGVDIQFKTKKYLQEKNKNLDIIVESKELRRS